MSLSDEEARKIREDAQDRALQHWAEKYQAEKAAYEASQKRGLGCGTWILIGIGALLFLSFIMSGH